MKTILLDDFLDNGIIREKSFRNQVNNLNLNKFDGEKAIIKGCSCGGSTWAYLIITAEIAQVADKIYYGEPRYAVKIFSRKKNENIRKSLSWENYFMNISKEVARVPLAIESRSCNCSRQNNLSTGYNAV